MGKKYYKIVSSDLDEMGCLKNISVPNGFTSSKKLKDGSFAVEITTEDHTRFVADEIQKEEFSLLRSIKK